VRHITSRDLCQLAIQLNTIRRLDERGHPQARERPVGQAADSSHQVTIIVTGYSGWLR